MHPTFVNTPESTHFQAYIKSAPEYGARSEKTPWQVHLLGHHGPQRLSFDSPPELLCGSPCIAISKPLNAVIAVPRWAQLKDLYLTETT